MDELRAVGDPGLRGAVLFARSHSAAITADELAAKQGIHRSVARARLDRLVEAGLLTASFQRRSGRTGPGAGRPAKLYSVPPALTSIEFPERRYGLLVGHLVDAVPRSRRAARLHDVGTAFGADVAQTAGLKPARSIRAGAERICVALGRLGYQAAVEQVTGDGAAILTPTCPLRPLVREHPEASAIDRGFWAAMAASGFGVPVERVACTTCDCHADDASCRVAISVSSDD
jgi:predicted ArsR family transcriptional regulator